MRTYILLFTVIFMSPFISSGQEIIRIPGDTNLVVLAEKVILETEDIKVEIAKNSAIISEARNQKYYLYEETLRRAYEKLIEQDKKVGELLTLMDHLRTQLDDLDTENGEVNNDLEQLKKIEEELSETQKELNDSNKELEKIHEDFEHLTGKLEKQKKVDNLIKGLIGAGGLVIGLVIGLAI